MTDQVTPTQDAPDVATIQALQSELANANIHLAAVNRRLQKAQSELINMEGQLFQYEQILQSRQ